MWQFHHSEFIPVQSYPYFSPEDGVLAIVRFSYIKNKDSRLWIAWPVINYMLILDEHHMYSTQARRRITLS
ncbi:hypothetical protein VN97_g1498 [Penicillium thymicola]|uniref:Uncharacterized protein n=1 Tax=Penicillium thymicola TaxID=293382 RepID=A0AAI9TQV4_PENTH|nr:hypothetical protein VN97_g1498 [Penicillium thymicola]